MTATVKGSKHSIYRYTPRLTIDHHHGSTCFAAICLLDIDQRRNEISRTTTRDIGFLAINDKFVSGHHTPRSPRSTVGFGKRKCASFLPPQNRIKVP